jgi:putative transposase
MSLFDEKDNRIEIETEGPHPLGPEGLSASAVSRLNGRLSERLERWRARPVEGEHPYLYLDGISLTIRWGGASERVSVLVALGVNAEGYREILAVRAGFRESEESWRGLFRELVERGLQGTQLVISDACAGLRAALSDFLPEAAWQRCTFHVLANVLDKDTEQAPPAVRCPRASARRWPRR